MEYYILRYNGMLKGQSGECCKSKYTTDKACKDCGTGAELDGPLITLGLNKVKDDFFETYDGDFVISEDLHRKMIASGLVISALHDILDRNKKRLPFIHLNPTISFPKANFHDGLVIENQCTSCMQDGYFNNLVTRNSNSRMLSKVAPTGLSYHSLDYELLKLSDVFRSWEHMGNSNINVEGNKVLHYARPMLIVSQSFQDFVIHNEVRNIEFEKIEIC